MEEPYHGYTLKNSVLRVPLYFHIPHSGNPSPVHAVMSVIDLFPSILNLCRIDNDYNGFAQDLLSSRSSKSFKCAQIHPDPLPNDLVFDIDQNPSTNTNYPGKQWSLFNEQVKHIYDEDNNCRQTVNVFDETIVDDPKWNNIFFDCKWDELCAASNWAKRSYKEDNESDRDILNRQLRDLGYLE